MYIDGLITKLNQEIIYNQHRVTKNEAKKKKNEAYAGKLKLPSSKTPNEKRG